MTTQILLVEDDPDVTDNLEDVLTRAGFDVRVACDGFDALYQASLAAPDLIILDLGLPDVTGRDLLQAIRETSTVPVVILTASDDPGDRYGTLTDGANAYLTKPYQDDDLVRCVREHLAAPRTTELRIGDLTLDLQTRQAAFGTRALQLMRDEFELLHVLATHAGRAHTPHELAQALWGNHTSGSVSAVEIHLKNIHAKLDAVGGGRCLRHADPYGYALIPVSSPTVTVRASDTDARGRSLLAGPSAPQPQQAD